MTRRECGDCQLCCKLLPLKDNEPWRDGPPINKPAGVRCPHQKHHKGCAIYAKRPFCCQMWNCRWLVNDDADELSRPDRSHYVIDVMPDYVTLQPHDGGPPQDIQVVQIWIDPKHPEAHRDPALRRWMFRRAQEGIATIIRFNAVDAITVFPPPLDKDGEWHEIAGQSLNREHTLIEKAQAMGRLEMKVRIER
jgi:hypothetical protein